MDIRLINVFNSHGYDSQCSIVRNFITTFEYNLNLHNSILDKKSVEYRLSLRNLIDCYGDLYLALEQLRFGLGISDSIIERRLEYKLEESINIIDRKNKCISNGNCYDCPSARWHVVDGVRSSYTCDMAYCSGKSGDRIWNI